MIAHALARRALRAKLMTLQVATTGSATLSATATGYARAAGSFLTDGFFPGMEVAPTGFTQTTVGVIEAVTALTMTIKAGRTVQASGAGRRLSVRLPAARVWENKEFLAVAGVPYVVEQYIPGPMRQITLGSLGELEATPIYAPHIYVPAGNGPEAADAYADALLALFAPLTALTISGSTLRVRSDVAPYRGQMLQSAPGFAVVPVNIPLRLRTANVASPVAPGTPTLTVSGVLITGATLTSSAFSDANPGDTHDASQWQVTTTADTGFAAPVLSTGDDATNLTSYAAAGLLESTGYLARVRHLDSGGLYSEWSASAAFSTPVVGPLDNYTTALAAAYSTRRLLSAWGGSAVRVRRSSDNAEQNIGFTALGSLDTATLLAFCGAGSGFVVTWYDQSGNEVDATQSTAASQARIVNSGVLDEAGGQAALRFDDSNDRLVFPTIDLGTVHTVFAAIAPNALDDGMILGGGGSMIPLYLAASGGNKWFCDVTSGSTTPLLHGMSIGVHYVMELVRNGTTVGRLVDGVSLGAGTMSANNPLTVSRIGDRENNAAPFGGLLTDILMYTAELSSGDRAAIRAVL